MTEDGFDGFVEAAPDSYAGGSRTDKPGRAVATVASRLFAAVPIVPTRRLPALRSAFRSHPPSGAPTGSGLPGPFCDSKTYLMGFNPFTLWGSGGEAPSGLFGVVSKGNLVRARPRASGLDRVNFIPVDTAQ